MRPLAHKIYKCLSFMYYTSFIKVNECISTFPTYLPVDMALTFGRAILRPVQMSNPYLPADMSDLISTKLLLHMGGRNELTNVPLTRYQMAPLSHQAQFQS